MNDKQQINIKIFAIAFLALLISLGLILLLALSFDLIANWFALSLFCFITPFLYIYVKDLYLEYQANLNMNLTDLSSLENKFKKIEIINNRIFEVIYNINQAIFILDLSGKIIKINKTASNMLKSDAIGKDILEALHISDLSTAVELVAANKNKQTVEFSINDNIEIMYEAVVLFNKGIFNDNYKEGNIIISIDDITAYHSTQQAQSDFVANVSHELRTPLACIIGFLETIQGSARDDKDARDEFVAIMLEQSHRMNRLIGGLLNLSKIEAKEHNIPIEKVHIFEVVHSAIYLLKDKAKIRGIKISNKVDKSIYIRGSHDEILQIMVNLIKNSIKYGLNDCPIIIDSGVYSENQFAISVKDSSNGILPLDIPRLTERFFRVDPARATTNLQEGKGGKIINDKTGGTGLGLAIVKHILNRHRGKLIVESEIDKGSVFKVVLPKYEKD